MLKVIVITIICLCICGIIAIIYNHNDIKLERYVIESEKIPQSFSGYKIVQISDLHNRNFGTNNDIIKEYVNEENPDIVVFTGDMITKKEVKSDSFIELAKYLSDKYHTYYIIGNHEQGLSTKEFATLMKRVKNETNLIVLNNNHVEISKNNESINIYRLWYGKVYYTDKKNKRLTKEIIDTYIGKLDEKMFNILLTHNPLYFDTYIDYGADLTLTGHVHGGVIRIPFLGGVLSPQLSFFPKYDAGLYEKDNKYMIANRGLGYGGLKLRMFNHHEISSIVLKSK